MPPTCFICSDKQINYSTKCSECSKSVCEVCFVKLTQTECLGVCIKCPFCNNVYSKSFDDLDSNVNVNLLKKMSVDLHKQKMLLLDTEKYYKQLLSGMRKGIDYLKFIFEDFFILDERKVMKKREFIEYMTSFADNDRERAEIDELISDDIQPLI